MSSKTKSLVDKLKYVAKYSILTGLKLVTLTATAPWFVYSIKRTREINDYNTPQNNLEVKLNCKLIEWYKSQLKSLVPEEAYSLYNNLKESIKKYESFPLISKLDATASNLKKELDELLNPKICQYYTKPRDKP